MKRYIAIGFDGTVVKNAYPFVGNAVDKAEAVLKDLQVNGVRIILSTLRTGEELSSAVEWFSYRGIRLFGVNQNPDQKSGDKLWAHTYVDICNVGCPTVLEDGEKVFVDWDAVREALVSAKFLPETLMK